LLSLSELGEEEATIRTIALSIKANRLHEPDVQKCITRLLKIAEARESAAAMATAGQIAEARGQHHKAIEWYKAVVELTSKEFEPPTEYKMSWRESVAEVHGAQDIYGLLGEDDPFSFDQPVVKAHIALGRLLMTHVRPPDVEGARKAYEVGAFIGHDPGSYRRLGDLEQQWTEKWLEYHSLAAAAGDYISQYELGKFYSIPDLFLDGVHPILLRLQRCKDRQQYNEILDEIWNTFQLTLHDLESLNNKQVKKTFQTQIPANLRSQEQRFAYAGEWLHLAAIQFFEVWTGQKLERFSTFFPAGLALRKLLNRDDMPDWMGSFFAQESQNVAEMMLEIPPLKDPGEYHREMNQIRQIDWNSFFEEEDQEDQKDEADKADKEK